MKSAAGAGEFVYPYNNNQKNILLGKSKLHKARGGGAENELRDHIRAPLRADA